MQLSLLLFSLFALAAQAVPTERLEKRGTTCGRNTYSTAQVNAASNAACAHIRSGTVAGGSSYPHRYNNYEGFNFRVSGPYYEFPLKTSGVYNGGSPGADRVVINSACAQAGQMTHTGASGNSFVGCSGTY
ncbi:ribonuclease [Colletotrichum zoysiae]|uniref:ribonuclease T1 n=1 Tax=Colletotrichum zoysiae TaxID=1216348 RepID=A0AAD9HN32_9PEZI|nr:ribonuclease [Colletotrichum zoysiae]